MTSSSGPMATPATPIKPIDPAASSAERSGRRLSGGWMIVADKELGDHVGSLRFFIVLMIVAVAGIIAMYSAADTLKSLNSTSGQLAGQPSVFIRVFSVSPTIAGLTLPSFVGFMALLGPLFGIAFGFDAVNGERAERTLPRLLAQPIHRDDVINGKFVAGIVAIGLAIISVTAIVSAVVVFKLGIVPSAEDVLRLLLWIVITIVYVSFWLAFAMLCSVLLRRAANSALVALALWLALALFGGLLVAVVANAIVSGDTSASQADQYSNAQLQQLLTALQPAGLYQQATQAILDPTFRAFVALQSQLEGAIQGTLSFTQSVLIVWQQIVALVAITVIVFAGAYIAFLRQEVRA